MGLLRAQPARSGASPPSSLSQLLLLPAAAAEAGEGWALGAGPEAGPRCRRSRLTCRSWSEAFAPSAVGISAHLLFKCRRGLSGLRHRAGGASLRRKKSTLSDEPGLETKGREGVSDMSHSMCKGPEAGVWEPAHRRGSNLLGSEHCRPRSEGSDKGRGRYLFQSECWAGDEGSRDGSCDPNPDSTPVWNGMDTRTHTTSARARSHHRDS